MKLLGAFSQGWHSASGLKTVSKNQVAIVMTDLHIQMLWMFGICFGKEKTLVF
ncbi:hypothetical protein JCM17039_27910 [Blautia glucerasea]